MRVRSEVVKACGLVLLAAGWAVGAGAQAANSTQGAQTGTAARPRSAAAASHAAAAHPAATKPMVAATPPMGWNSWNFFAGKVTDKDIRDTADLLVSTGMRDAGYVYVNIDDTWEGERDANGKIQSNSKFPT